MGREALAITDWQGQTVKVKALLESQEIILRSPIRARIPRSEISGVTVDGDRLRLVVDGEPLTLTLGATEADRWAIVLLKPPPSLAEKLGISVDKRAYLMGSLDDETLRSALTDAMTDALADASVIVAVLAEQADLDAACTLAATVPHLALWCVYPKGRNSPVGDAVIRAHLRERGYVDSKSSAVSDRLTATRYARRKST
jgi:hypothetical protein